MKKKAERPPSLKFENEHLRKVARLFEEEAKTARRNAEDVRREEQRARRFAIVLGQLVGCAQTMMAEGEPLLVQAILSCAQDVEGVLLRLGKEEEPF